MHCKLLEVVAKTTHSHSLKACICNDPNIGDKGGVLAVMTGGRITRHDYTVQAIQMAILALNPAHFDCSSSVPSGINDDEETIFGHHVKPTEKASSCCSMKQHPPPKNCCSKD